MTTNRRHLFAGAILTGALLVGTAGLAFAQDPTTPSGLPGANMDGSGMMGGRAMSGGSGVMDGATMGTMHASMTADQLKAMGTMHASMHARGR